jgi:2-polyprenyl-6-methoxyphenol hydroxylase-like FAD-dependent oxidoreductase
MTRESRRPDGSVTVAGVESGYRLHLSDSAPAWKTGAPLLTEVIEQDPSHFVRSTTKLLWRDPVRKWVLDHGRVALVEDAAHPYLSTSGTGGAQAVKDRATIKV